MGEDLAADGRMAVRTPMQWNNTKNGGFSTAAPSKLIQRVAPGGYAPEHVNLADQRDDPDSLWTFIRSLVAGYRRCPEIGWGQVQIVEQPHHQVLAHRCDLDDSAVLAVHNLSAEPVTLDLPVTGADAHTVVANVLSKESVELADGVVQVALEGYGHQWMRVHRDSDPHLA